MRVVVADGAVDLALERHALESRAIGAREPRGERSPSPCRAWSAWPAGRACARASRRRRARARARAGPRAIACSAGSSTSCRACASATPCARLLMSSDVHAKWMNSATRAISGTPAKRSFSQYSTALTSWLVVRSIALTRAASASAKSRPAASSAARAAASNGRHFGDRRLVGKRRAATRSRSRTRWRISAYSLKCVAQRASLCRIAAVERRQRVSTRAGSGDRHSIRMRRESQQAANGAAV